MSSTNNKLKFNKKEMGELIEKEIKYVMNLFSMLPIPSSAQKTDSDSDDEVEVTKKPNLIENKTKRVQTITELQERLDAIKKTKKKLSYKDKLLKKGIKNRMKKKSKQMQKNEKLKLTRAVKLEEQNLKTEKTESTKPVFNSENKMVFSKIDFANLGKTKEKKQEKDPKKILQNIKKQKEKLEKLVESGEAEKATEIKEKQVWKNAISKAQGEKVKDDPELLKKSVKKQEQKKKSSKKKWDARITNVEKQKAERQKKRTENIQKKKKQNKVHKLKQAVKRGKIIPGF